MLLTTGQVSSYARQVVEHAELLEQRYLNKKQSKTMLHSTQHYAFAVQAFVSLIRDQGASEYECTLRETRTYEIIEDVRHLRSEIGLLYMSEFNQRVFRKILQDRGSSSIRYWSQTSRLYWHGRSARNKEDSRDRRFG